MSNDFLNGWDDLTPSSRRGGGVRFQLSSAAPATSDPAAAHSERPQPQGRPSRRPRREHPHQRRRLRPRDRIRDREISEPTSSPAWMSSRGGGGGGGGGLSSRDRTSTTTGFTSSEDEDDEFSFGGRGVRGVFGDDFSDDVGFRNDLTGGIGHDGSTPQSPDLLDDRLIGDMMGLGIGMGGATGMDLERDGIGDLDLMHGRRQRRRTRHGHGHGRRGGVPAMGTATGGGLRGTPLHGSGTGSSGLGLGLGSGGIDTDEEVELEMDLASKFRPSNKFLIGPVPIGTKGRLGGKKRRPESSRSRFSGVGGSLGGMIEARRRKFDVSLSLGSVNVLSSSSSGGSDGDDDIDESSDASYSGSSGDDSQGMSDSDSGSDLGTRRSRRRRRRGRHRRPRHSRRRRVRGGRPSGQKNVRMRLCSDAFRAFPELVRRSSSSSSSGGLSSSSGPSLVPFRHVMVADQSFLVVDVYDTVYFLYGESEAERLGATRGRKQGKQLSSEANSVSPVRFSGLRKYMLSWTPTRKERDRMISSGSSGTFLSQIDQLYLSPNGIHIIIISLKDQAFYINTSTTKPFAPRNVPGLSGLKLTSLCWTDLRGGGGDVGWTGLCLAGTRDAKVIAFEYFVEEDELGAGMMMGGSGSGLGASAEADGGAGGGGGLFGFGRRRKDRLAAARKKGRGRKNATKGVLRMKVVFNFLQRSVLSRIDDGEVVPAHHTHQSDLGGGEDFLSSGTSRNPVGPITGIEIIRGVQTMDAKWGDNDIFVLVASPYMLFEFCGGSERGYAAVQDAQDVQRRVKTGVGPLPMGMGDTSVDPKHHVDAASPSGSSSSSSFGGEDRGIPKSFLPFVRIFNEVMMRIKREEPSVLKYTEVPRFGGLSDGDTPISVRTRQDSTARRARALSVDRYDGGDWVNLRLYKGGFAWLSPTGLLHGKLMLTRDARAAHRRRRKLRIERNARRSSSLRRHGVSRDDDLLEDEEEGEIEISIHDLPDAHSPSRFMGGASYIMGARPSGLSGKPLSQMVMRESYVDESEIVRLDTDSLSGGMSESDESSTVSSRDGRESSSSRSRARSLAPASVLPIVAVAIDEYHLYVLHEDKLVVYLQPPGLCSSNPTLTLHDEVDAAIGTDQLAPTSFSSLERLFEYPFRKADGNPKGLLVDRETKKMFVYTTSKIWQLELVDPLKRVWRLFLERAINLRREDYFETAEKLLLPGPSRRRPARLNAVLRAKAEYYYEDEQYLKAARVFAMTSEPLEKVTMRYYYDPVAKPFLIAYLTEKLDLLKSHSRSRGPDEENDRSCKSQICCLITWITELYLHDLNDVSSQSGDVDGRSAKGIETRFRAFLRENKAYLQQPDMQQTIFALISSHAQTMQLIFFAKLIGQYEYVLTSFLTEGLHERTLETLKKHCSKDEFSKLWYQFTPILIEHIPKPVFKAIMDVKFQFLEPVKLLPALMKYLAVRRDDRAVIGYLRWVIERLRNRDPAVHHLLIYLYARSPPSSRQRQQRSYDDHDPSDDRLSQYKHKEELLNLLSRRDAVYDPQYALRVCLEYDRTDACIYIYRRMGLHRDAVMWALRKDQVDRALSLSERVDDPTLKKRLWLMILRDRIRKDETVDKAIRMVKRLNESWRGSDEEKNVIRFEDILPFFPDHASVAVFKREILESLKNSGEAILALKADIRTQAFNLKSMHQGIRQVATQYCVVKSSSLCSVCHRRVLPSPEMYLFPCEHKFHKSCLVRRMVHDAEDELQLELRDLMKTIGDAKREIQAAGPAAGQGGSMDIPAARALAAARGRMHRLVSRECPLCGKMIVDSVLAPFFDPIRDAQDVTCWRVYTTRIDKMAVMLRERRDRQHRRRRQKRAMPDSDSDEDDLDFGRGTQRRGRIFDALDALSSDSDSDGDEL